MRQKVRDEGKRHDCGQGISSSGTIELPLQHRQIGPCGIVSIIQEAERGTSWPQACGKTYHDHSGTSMLLV